MKRFLALLLLLAPFESSAKGGGSLPPVCTASPPSQASAAGITSLIMCNTFAVNNSADVNNTKLPGFQWYVNPPFGGSQIPAPSQFTNDGTGLEVIGSASGDAGHALSVVGNSSVSPYYVGTPVSGSFYAEMDMKFNPVTPASQVFGNSPAFWLTGTLFRLNGVVQPGAFPVAEIDTFECLPNTAGSNCIPNNQIHLYHTNGTNVTDVCDSTSYQTLAGSPNLNNYNTFGILLKRAADFGGTGTIGWYINNTLNSSCTYTSTTMTCTSGSFSGSSCISSDLYNAMEVQASTFMVGAGLSNLAGSDPQFPRLALIKRRLTQEFRRANVLTNQPRRVHNEFTK